MSATILAVAVIATFLALQIRRTRKPARQRSLLRFANSKRSRRPGQ